MSSIICEICNKNYSSISSLKKHQKICNKQKENICCSCNKVFSTIYTLQRHYNSCTEYQIKTQYEKIIEEQKQKISIIQTQYEKIIEEQERKINTLQTQYDFIKIEYTNLRDKYDSFVEKSVLSPKIINHNNYNHSSSNLTVKQYVSTLQPITSKDFEDTLDLYTEKYIDEGAIGYAKFLLDHPCNNKIITTDLSRKVVAYRTEKNEFIKDPKCRELIKMAVGNYKDEILNKNLDRRSSLANIQHIDNDPVMFEIYGKKLNDITEFIIFLKNDLEDYDYTNVPNKISSQISNTTPQYNNVKAIQELE